MREVIKEKNSHNLLYRNIQTHSFPFIEELCETLDKLIMKHFVLILLSKSTNSTTPHHLSLRVNKQYEYTHMTYRTHQLKTLYCT